MKMRTGLIGCLLAVGTLCLSGCHGGSFAFSYEDDHRGSSRRRHRDGPDHVCVRGCNHHYYNGARLVSLRGHRHRAGCGHHWSGTFWVRASGGSHGHRANHVCSRGCNRHFYNGKRLVDLRGHRHGADCGHRWSGTYWVVASKHDHARKKAHPHSGVRRVH